MTVSMSLKSSLLAGLTAAGALAAFALPAVAQEAAGAVSAIDKGDTTFMLMSTILVLLMILPGLALFMAVWCGPRTCFRCSCSAPW
jgi:Amt family ammonium transporter